MTLLDMRSDLRRAYEDRDADAFMAALRERCLITDADCWQWQMRVDRDGYPQIRFGKGATRLAVHRLSLEVALGRTLGRQSAHHACANRSCVNPAHLQPVTHAANAAEMLARRYYMDRIASLESALADVAPNHPLLVESDAGAA